MKRTFIAIIMFAVILTALGENSFAQRKIANQTKSYEELIDKYFESLNETDAKRRRALVEQVWTESGVFVYPGQEVKGFASISSDVERVQKQYPGALVCRESRIEVVHDNYIRFTWEFGAPGKKPLITGVDFAVISPDGKLQLVVGFFDTMPNTGKN